MRYKFAYLILAHHQPKQLLRLVKAIYTPNTVIYIHLDLKRDSKPFTTLFARHHLTDVLFIKDRVNVYWGGFSMVKATLNLMQKASADYPYKYYHLLSGSDFPIKSNEYIARFFSKSSKEYIGFLSCLINHHGFIGLGTMILMIK